MGGVDIVFVGVSVIWLLTMGTQGEHTSFKPVAALWICVIPLMDMLAIVVRRYKKVSHSLKLTQTTFTILFSILGLAHNKH